jgi:hypothetical protein
MEGTPGDSQYKSHFFDDSESQLLPCRGLDCGVQADDEDAGFVTPVPPPHTPSLLEAAATPIPAPLLSASTVGATVGVTAGASRETSSLEYISMQVGKDIKDSLKFYLRCLNIIVIRSKAKGIKADAVATRVPQLGVTVAEAYAVVQRVGFSQGGPQ